MNIRPFRQSYVNCDYKEMDILIQELEILLEDLNVQNASNEIASEIMKFQDENGGFNLLDTYNVPADIRVMYCYRPTYICSAILIKLLMYNCKVEKKILNKALNVCIGRGFKGHGTSAVKDQVKNINSFIKGDIYDFLDTYKNMNLQFFQMINDITNLYEEYLQNGTTIFDVNYDFKDEFKSIVNSIKVRKIASDIIKSALIDYDLQGDIAFNHRIQDELGLPEGDSVEQIKERIRTAIPLRRNTTLYQYDRNARVAANALIAAEYKCECNITHKTFIRRRDNKPYMEAHHLIPINAQDRYSEYSIDREANIVSLCCNCHNQIHYGSDIESILKPLFLQRETRLKHVGINITYKELLSYYVRESEINV